MLFFRVWISIIPADRIRFCQQGVIDMDYNHACHIRPILKIPEALKNSIADWPSLGNQHLTLFEFLHQGLDTNIISNFMVLRGGLH